MNRAARQVAFVLVLVFAACLSQAGTIYLVNRTALTYSGSVEVTDGVVIFRQADGTLVSLRKSQIDWTRTRLPSAAEPGRPALPATEATGAQGTAGKETGIGQVIVDTNPAEQGSNQGGVLVSRGGGTWEFIPEQDVGKVMEFLRLADAHKQTEGESAAQKDHSEQDAGADQAAAPQGAAVLWKSTVQSGLRPADPADTPSVAWQTAGLSIAGRDLQDFSFLPEIVPDEPAAGPGGSERPRECLEEIAAFPAFVRPPGTLDEPRPHAEPEPEPAIVGRVLAAPQERILPAPPPPAAQGREPALQRPSIAPAQRPESITLVPRPGEYVSGNTTVGVDLPSSMEDQVSRVSFFVDGRPMAEVAAPPFRARWDAGNTQGIRRITAVVDLHNGDSLELQSLVREVETDDSVLVNLIPLNVSVINGQYLIVRDLEEQDFMLLEDGVPQTIRSFSRDSVPLSVVLLIDISFSMKGAKLRSAKAAAERFVETLRAGDRAGLVAFDDRVFVLNKPSFQFEAFRESIRALEAGEGTSLFDATCRGISLLEGEMGRKAIIILSDGEDYHSKAGFEQVVDMARRSDIQIYAVGMYGRRMCEGGGDGHWTDAYLNGEQRPGYWSDRLALRGIKFLKDITLQTGGILYLPKFFYELPYVYKHILFDLQNQYLLEYYPTNAEMDGSWREINVTVKGRRFMVRTRKGYFAPEGAG